MRNILVLSFSRGTMQQPVSLLKVVFDFVSLVIGKDSTWSNRPCRSSPVSLSSLHMAFIQIFGQTCSTCFSVFGFNSLPSSTGEKSLSDVASLRLCNYHSVDCRQWSMVKRNVLRTSSVLIRSSSRRAFDGTTSFERKPPEWCTNFAFEVKWWIFRNGSEIFTSSSVGGRTLLLPQDRWWLFFFRCFSLR